MRYCPQCKRQYPDAMRFCADDNQILSLQDPYHLVGRTLAGKYRIEALVGIGGMGAVYCAQHIGIERQVAFKILQPNVALSNERVASLFEQEAKVVGHLNHENIADIKDAGRTDDGIAYLVMEWLDGHTLDEELAAAGQLSLERAAGIIRQIAAALEAAHVKNIVHRDLKPSNIMLVKGPQGREQVKVLDFGIAKVISNTAGSPVSAVMGTPHYASPEQLQVGGLIDGRSDIYSLGVIFYRMLTGTHPFNASSVPELIRMHLSADAPSIHNSRPDVPASIEQTISRMLLKDPSQRPQRAGDVTAILDSVTPSGNELETTLGQDELQQLQRIIVMEGAQTIAIPAEIAGRRLDNTVILHPPQRALQSRSNRWKYAAAIVTLAVTTGLLIYYRDVFLNAGAGKLSSGSSAPLPASTRSFTEDLGNGVELVMLQLPGGQFEMGSDDGESDEKPKHPVKVEPFAIGRYEVTQAQWKAVMGSDNNPSYFRVDDNHPVENVSWNMAQDFIKRLRNKTGNQGYRLPSESEWEYAARAGSTGKWGFGDDESKLNEYAWYSANAIESTHPVGTRQPNNWGLFDMHGNVLEWCEDWYDENSYQQEAADNRRKSLSSTYHVRRGGCLVCAGEGCRSSYRDYQLPDHLDKYNGFRVAISAKSR